LYLHGRHTLGIEDPIILTKLKNYVGMSPDDISIVAVPSRNIPDDVFITRDPIGTGHLGEIRVFGEVPTLGSKKVSKLNPKKEEFYDWDVRR
jgi:hypothetical protein